MYIPNMLRTIGWHQDKEANGLSIECHGFSIRRLLIIYLFGSSSNTRGIYPFHLWFIPLVFSVRGENADFLIVISNLQCSFANGQLCPLTFISCVLFV